MIAHEPGAGDHASTQGAAADGSLSDGEPRWPLLYGAVLAELALVIVLFYAFTRAFA